MLDVSEATKIMRLEAERAMLQEQLSREPDITWYFITYNYFIFLFSLFLSLLQKGPSRGLIPGPPAP